jgi:hypothetical protein
MLTIIAAGMIVTAVAAPVALVLGGVLLLSFSSSSSYQAAMAQQEIPDTDATTTTGDGGVKATTTDGGGGGNQTISEAIMHLQEARTALQNNDTQGAMMELDIALNVLGNATQGGNMTTTTVLGDNATGRFGGGGLSGGGVDY